MSSLTIRTRFAKYITCRKNCRNLKETMNSSHKTPAGCEVDLLLSRKRLQQFSFSAQALLILLIAINILASPLTAVLNALVMISVKMKSRLRAHKSNVLLALLAFADFSVGILVQPAIAMVLTMLLLEQPLVYCEFSGG